MGERREEVYEISCNRADPSGPELLLLFLAEPGLALRNLATIGLVGFADRCALT